MFFEEWKYGIVWKEVWEYDWSYGLVNWGDYIIVKRDFVF